MSSQNIQIPFPYKGVNKNWAFSEQAPMSSRDSQNMRWMDPKNRRLRGAQRPGLSTFITGQVNGAKKIQHLTHITHSQKSVDWERNDTAAEVNPVVWSASPTRLNQAADEAQAIKVDPEGNVFILFGANGIQILSADGVEVQTFYAPISEPTQLVQAMELDIFGNLYLGIGNSNNVATVGAIEQILFKYSKRPKVDETSWEYVLEWTLAPPVAGATHMLIKAMFYSTQEDRLYCVGGRQDAVNSNAYLMRVEALDSPAPTVVDAPALELSTVAGGVNLIRHVRDIVVRDDGTVFIACYQVTGTGFGVGVSIPFVGMYRNLGDQTSGLVTATQEIGFGAGVGSSVEDACGGYMLALDRLDNTVVYTCGPRMDSLDVSLDRWGVTALRDATSGTVLDFAQYEFIEDDAPTAFTTSFYIGTGSPNFGPTPKMAVDAFNNIYCPFPRSTLIGVVTDPPLAGLLVWTVLVINPRDGGVFADNDIMLEYLDDDTDVDASRGALAIAVRQSEPDYEDDLTGGVPTPALDAAEFFYYIISSEEDFGGTGPTNTFTVAKARQVFSTQGTDPPRATVYLAIANGLVKVIDSGGDTISNPVTNPGVTAGDQLSGTADYIDSTILLSRVYFTDGETYLRYDPRDDVLETLTASMGELPGRCRLIAAWRDRIVLARSDGEDGPHNWFMSRAGDPLDWDEAPAVEDRGQAISGNNPAGAGLVPDIINSLIPYNDDLLFFLCDHSIHRLTGDPLLGGQLDLVTDKVGGVFGKPWTKDREGRILLLDSEGGMNELTATGLVRLSRDSIEDDLRNIDFSTNHVRLEWDNDSEGVHVMVFPFGTTGSTATQHWFWDQRSKGFWPSTFSIPPTAITTFDGDAAADRVVVMGFDDSDGRVRLWDEDAEDDDGNSIDSHILFGPIMSSSAPIEYRWSHLIPVLARDQGGARYELYAADQADSPLTAPYRDGVLGPGRNQAIKERARGSYFYVRLRNSGATRWAFESMSIQASEAGRKRVRS